MYHLFLGSQVSVGLPMYHLFLGSQVSVGLPMVSVGLPMYHLFLGSQVRLSFIKQLSFEGSLTFYNFT